MTTDELLAAAERVLMQHFHEDEPSPLMRPEEDDHIRDDCIACAECVVAVVAALRGRRVDPGRDGVRAV